MNANQPLHGEVTLKEWLCGIAQRRGMTLKYAYSLFARGKIAPSKVRRVNRSVVFVVP